MGTNNSKENPESTLSIIQKNNNIWQSSIKNKIINYSGWEEICRCSHTDWLHGISRMNLFSS